MDYRINPMEIVSLAFKKFTDPREFTVPKVQVSIEIKASENECFKVELERGKFSIFRGDCAVEGGEDISTRMSILQQNQDGLGRVRIFVGSEFKKEFDCLDSFWEHYVS